MSNNLNYIFKSIFTAFLLTVSFSFIANAQVRIKDIVDFEGVRDNSLIGYGLVVGLNGTGDSLQSVAFTQQSLESMLEKFGTNVSGERMRTNNIAAVMITAKLPPFARQGSKIDVTVSAMGDATSLLGGTLIPTDLTAANGAKMAIAEGSIVAGGFSAQGQAESVTSGVPTSARIPNGGTVEQEVAFDLDSMESVKLALRDPDFTTAIRIQEVINRNLGDNTATMDDSGTVTVDVPNSFKNKVAYLLARLENFEVIPDQPAKVIIDERTGTIVMGDNVRISRVAVTQGNLTVRVTEAPQVSQPNPFADGDTIIVPRTNIDVEQEDRNIAVIEAGTDLRTLVQGLNSLGVNPRDMISILHAIKQAGALHAELKTM